MQKYTAPVTYQQKRMLFMEKIRFISDELKKIYGQKIYKLSLQSGCTCPNRDGTAGTGGCTFCSEGGSGDFAAPLNLPSDRSDIFYRTDQSISLSSRLGSQISLRDVPAAETLSSQIEFAKKRVDSKISSKIPPEERLYIAYFQSFTNTYGDFGKLKVLFTEAIKRPDIVTLSIATRPDCISDDMLSLLSDLNRIKPVWIELGLQTIHEATARRINRCYPLSCYEETYRRLKSAGLTVITHVILGLPGETHADMYETIRYLAGLDPVLDGIKLQLLHILKGTRLYDEYLEKPFHIMSLDEYAEVIIQCIRLLPEETIVHRITGDGPKSLLVEPLWSANKKNVLNTINKKLRIAGLL